MSDATGKELKALDIFCTAFLQLGKEGTVPYGARWQACLCLLNKATAKILILGDENARLREALNHIKDMQTFGYIVLGEEATGKMTAALAGEPKDLGPMHPGLPSEKVEVAR